MVHRWGMSPWTVLTRGAHPSTLQPQRTPRGLVQHRCRLHRPCFVSSARRQCFKPAPEALAMASLAPSVPSGLRRHMSPGTHRKRVPGDPQAQHSWCGLTTAESLAVSPPLTYRQWFVQRSPGTICLLCSHSGGLCSTWCPPGPPVPFSAKLLCSWVAPHIYWCLALFLPRGKTRPFSSSRFMGFLSSHFSNLSRSLWMAARPSAYQPHLPVWYRQEILLRVCSGPLLMEMLNRSEPRIPRTDPWDTQLVTGPQLDFVPPITSLWTQPFSQFSVFSARPACTAQNPRAGAPNRSNGFKMMEGVSCIFQFVSAPKIAGKWTWENLQVRRRG